MLIVGHPLCTPGLRGEQNWCVTLTTGAQDRHSAPPSAGSALVPPNLPHFCAAYGRLVLAFKPAGLFL